MTDKTNAGHDKQAVDANAGAYWAEYFGEYGKQWVRTIPRRVATALISRTASKEVNPRDIAALAATATVRPIMPRPVITEDRVFIEATLDLPGGDRRLFCAEFDHDGKLHGIDTMPIPSSRTAARDDSPYYDDSDAADAGINYDPESSGRTPESELQSMVEYMDYLGLSPEQQEKEVRRYKMDMPPIDPRLGPDPRDDRQMGDPPHQP